MEFLFGFLSYVYVTLAVALGLGMVIFVHELGHFVVAKLCGVRCDKFYLGFDIAGYKFFKFKKGETEYGIGILPLGGYVKMLGQEDNPARLKDEIEKAKAAGKDEIEDVEGKKVDLTTAEAALYDPRSYLAKSVPQRMAIISAGVIMNLIFAFVIAVIAFGLGVRQVGCGVGGVLPGDAAWRADLQVGDRIVKINGRESVQFGELKSNVSLGDIEGGVPMVVERPGSDETRSITLVPEKGPDELMPTVGSSRLGRTDYCRLRIWRTTSSPDRRRPRRTRRWHLRIPLLRSATFPSRTRPISTPNSPCIATRR